MKQKQIIAQELHSTQSALSTVDFKSGQTFTGRGSFPLDCFPRLLGEVHKNLHQADAQVTWEFLSWIDLLPTGHEQYRLRLVAQTTIPLVCQRCLGEYLQAVEVDSQFVLLDTQHEVDDFPLENDDEDALLNSFEFNLFDLLEDELLLALPIVPKHQDENCHEQLLHNIEVSDDHAEINSHLIDPKTGKLNPFLQLKKLKLN